MLMYKPFVHVEPAPSTLTRPEEPENRPMSADPLFSTAPPPVMHTVPSPE